MSALQEQKTKKTTAIRAMVEEMRKGSKNFYQGVEISLVKSELPKSLDAVEVAVLSRRITMWDFHVLKNLYRLKFATVGQLEAVLYLDDVNRKKKGLLPIAAVAVGAVALRKRLEMLSQHGFVHIRRYKDASGSLVYIYQCSMSGYRAFSIGFDMPQERFDCILDFASDCTVFRQLVSNFIACSFAYSPMCEKIYFQEKLPYTKDGRKKQFSAYARVVMTDDNGERIQYLIEPTMFAHDGRASTDEMAFEKIGGRISELEAYLDALNAEPQDKDCIDTYGVFVVEDHADFEQLVELIKTRDLALYENKFFCTCERLISRIAVPKEESYIGFRVVDGRFMVVQKKLKCS